MPSIDRGHMRTKRTSRTLAILLTFIGLAAPAHDDAAAAIPAARCVAAKIRAVGKAVFDKAKCHQRAVAAGTAVDPACLAKAETRLAAAVSKADVLGPCAGTAAEFAGDVVQCVASFVTTTTPTSSTTSTTIAAGVESCCYGATMCTQTDTVSCSALTMIVGTPGSVCDGTTGGCAAAPAIDGPCCQVTGITGLSCLAGPSLNDANCATLDGTFYAAAACTPSGCVP